MFTHFQVSLNINEQESIQPIKYVFLFFLKVNQVISFLWKFLGSLTVLVYQVVKHSKGHDICLDNLDHHFSFSTVSCICYMKQITTNFIGQEATGQHIVGSEIIVFLFVY